MNQLYRNQTEEPLGLNKDLLAIRMASVNPILDPWIYILLRKTVVLTLMEKIKCLFCKMGSRGRRSGRQFSCTDRRLSSSIVSRDSPSLMSREMPEVVHTSQTLLYQSEGNTGRVDVFQSGAPDSQTLQGPHEVKEGQMELSRTDLGLTNVRTPQEPQMNNKDSTLIVTLTGETANTLEKCI